MRGQERRSSEGGAVAVLAAFVLITIGGFLALTMNVGHMMNARAQLQAASDSAALAATRSLNGSTGGQVTAHGIAKAYAIRHKLYTDAVAIDDNSVNLASGDVVSGFWDTNTKTFYGNGQVLPASVTGDTAITLTSLFPQWYNAVKVVTAADGGSGHNARLGVFFGGFVGATSGTTVRTTAVALGGGPCDENANVLPMVVPSCSLSDGSGNMLCGLPVVLSFIAGSGRDAAFADLTPPSGVVTESEVQDQLNSARNLTADVIRSGAPIATTDGSGFATSTVTGGFGGLNCSAPGPAYTGCRRFVMPVINLGSNCSAGIPAHATPVGFAQVVILNVTWTPGTRQIAVVPDCVNPSNRQGGCANFGFPPANRPRLVK